MSSIAPYALGQSVNNVVEIIPNNAIETVLDKFKCSLFLNWVFDGTVEWNNHNDNIQ